MVNRALRSSWSERSYQWIAIGTVLLISVASFYPLVYVVSMSLVGEAEWTAKGGFVLWPSSPTLESYKRLFETNVFTHALGISVLRTVIGTALTLSLTTITAYISSRRGLPGREGLVFCILVTILFSGGLIPTYIVVRDLGLLNSFWAMILPGAIYSWGALVLLQFFKSLPPETEESARIDGAGEIVLMWRIMLPLCAPAMAAIGLFIAVNHWNSWFDALIYINDADKYPMQLLVRNLLINPELGDQFNPQTIIQNQRVSMESLKMAAVVMGTIPILCVYPFLQKYFIKGMFTGAVKG